MAFGFLGPGADATHPAYLNLDHPAVPPRLRRAELPAGEPLLLLDEIHLSNAVKFTPDGGGIRVTLARQADCAVVAVADSGIGIAAEFLPFVFDMFRQQEQGTRREYQGLGIGLSLVKKLAELHKGSVRVASGGAGLGAEAVVRLPLAAGKDRPDERSPAGAEPSAPPLAGLRVLVVEDSDDARDSLRLMLQLFGAKVSVAGDGREALDMIGSVEADVVLCDLRMPRADGYAFIGALPQAHPPVAAMSGLASEADRERTRGAGFVAHLKKPFDETALIAALGSALGDRAPRPA